MGSCIICSTPVDNGYVCDSHQEDVIFEFRGDRASQLVPERFYQGTVDGYADFGVFIDIAPGVTGLLHRSELDRRLDSLDWEPGDTVCVRVNNVRDNGNIDLGKSIRQSDREFRGKIILDGDEEKLPEEIDDAAETDAGDAEPSEPADTDGGSVTVTHTDTSGGHHTEADDTEADDAEAQEAEQSEAKSEPAVDDDASEVAAEPDAEAAVETETAANTEPASTDDTAAVADAEAETNGAGAVAVTEREDADAETEGEDDVAAETESDAEYAETTVDDLSDQIGESIRLEGEIVSVRQTGGPTVFELSDETGVIDCAAFVEAGVRAYPDIEVGDIVRLDGEVEQRRGELQVETEALLALEGDERATVAQRLADALTDRARPDELDPIGDHDTVAGMSEELLDVAEAIRRAVLESRPVVIRHPATAAGYVAGAAIERAVLPLVREEHARSDAEYHYIVRRPLENAVYDMDDATNDATQMLQDRDRHDEKLPLFCFVGAGSTADSVDGLGLLGVYGAERVVLDAIAADPEVSDVAEQVVTGDAPDLSIGALTATLAAALNPDVSEDMQHLPAVSYWENTPEAYTEAAEAAGYDAEQVRHLREAIALEAYYQSYQDKRELITDLLFDDAGGLAGHIAEQFREKLDDELETAQANLDRQERDGVGIAVLDTDQFTHRFDFPPTSLLLDELHFVEREGEQFVTVGVGMDELYLRSTDDLDIRAVAEAAAENAPEADVTARGIREGRIEFLSGRREAARNAVLDAAAAQFD
ncbi:S1 RNA-binding domain-containing protein [Halonotius terrestris]|uniref:S1 RNA-binding domain-containing protein n=1 Tax=Halonotius terrestris TaxID=2487750 RepID=A0A8J8TBY7_9EURY|nr:OB-fold nucleic acid binding domain-containing protein [Halonotius terrestris]TQQ82622.1 S1 RNA-binding domain-containing protein [Halonotius terrestris]